MLSSTGQILRYYHALGFTPGDEFWINTYDHGVYSGVYSGDRIELWECRPTGKDSGDVTVWERLATPIADPIAKLRSLGTIGNVQSYPNHLRGGLGNKHAAKFTSLFYEIDDLSLEEQRSKLDWVRTTLGLNPSAVVFSGSKSLHVYFALSSAIDGDTWQRLSRQLAIVVGGDKAICTHARAMRLPGVPRVKGGVTREVTLESSSDDRYSAADIEQRLAPWFPHGLTYQRWLKWRREGDSVLAIPEADLNPKRGYKPIELTYDGSEVPLTIALTKADRDAIEHGAAEGERTETAFRLARNLHATANYLASQGVRFAPTAYELFRDFADKYTWPRGKDEQIWVNAGKGSATPSRTPESIDRSIAWHQRQSDPITRFSPKPRTITREEWIEKFGQSELCDRLNRAVRRSSGVLSYLKAKRAETVAKHSPYTITPNNTETAIELYDHTKREHPIAIGQPLPPPDEWIALGRPILTIDPNDNQADRWLELAALGYKAVLDSGETGRGKSHVAGELGQRVANGGTEFGRLIYFSSGYRNPSTESIEAAHEMPTRHNGLTTDYLRRTATNQPFRVRPKKGQTPDVPGNCPKSDVFAAAAGRDVKLFGGKESPICQGCPLFGGCEFLRDRARTLNSEAFIRADLSQFATLKPTDIAIVDEASIEIQATKAIKVSKDEIAAELQAISVALVARDDITAIEAHHAQIIGKAIYDSIDAILTAKQAEHGLSHLEMIAALPNLNRLRALLPSLGQGWVSFRDIDGALVRRAKRTIDRILAPNLEIFGQSESPEVQLARVKSLHQGAIGKVLSVLLGDRSIDLGTHHGNLTITRRNRRPGRTIASAGFSILMDATANKRDLARKLGIDAGDIVEIRAARSDYSNLTIQIIQGVGSCGRKRRDENTFDAGKRITYLLDHLKPEATIDYIDFADRYWFRDNRGSNEFKAMNHIAAVGLPTPNLGAAAAEWHALTGHAVSPTDRDGGYGAFVRRLIAAEILQLIGRPRSQWRPDEQITVTLIGDGFIGYQKEIAEQFPGATINVIDVIDICPIAATKGEQSARAIVNNIVSFARNGETITREKLAAVTGHSNPSKAIKDRFGVGLGELKDAVTFVLESLNTKVTVDWNSIPEQLRALLQECFGVSDTLATEDPDAAAQIILEAIEVARAEFGDALTLATLAYFPIAHFEPLLKALGRAEIAPPPIA